MFGQLERLQNLETGNISLALLQFVHAVKLQKAYQVIVV